MSDKIKQNFHLLHVLGSCNEKLYAEIIKNTSINPAIKEIFFNIAELNFPVPPADLEKLRKKSHVVALISSKSNKELYLKNRVLIQQGLRIALKYLSEIYG